MFEGLLPEPHNMIVLDLLFLMAHWHGLAKLRLHTDHTLAYLDRVTTELGEQLRVFKRRTCAAYKTGELPRETAARKRRKARPKTKLKTQPMKPEPLLVKEKITQPKPKQKLKEFNLNTYKTHSLGDYVDMIKKYGTTDSYSTEVVSYSDFQVLNTLRSFSRVNWSTKHQRLDIKEQAVNNF